MTERASDAKINFRRLFLAIRYKNKCLKYQYIIQQLLKLGQHCIIFISASIHTYFHSNVWKHIRGVTGGTDQASGECSLGQTIPI